MNSSTSLKSAVLILVLAATLSVKALGIRAAETPETPALEEGIKDFLSRHNFSVEKIQRPAGFEVIGRINDCRLSVREASIRGYNMSSIAALAPEGTQLVFAFRGEVFERPPLLRATLAYFVNRLQREFGISRMLPQMLAIAATPSCAPLPWAKYPLIGHLHMPLRVLQSLDA